MHLQPAYANMLAIGGAAVAFARGVARPSGSALTDGEIDEVIRSARKAVVRT